MNELFHIMEAEHRQVYFLMDELRFAKTYDAKKAIFKKLKKDLVCHMECEESSVYSKFDTCPLKTTSDFEHHQIRDLLQKLILSKFNSKKWWDIYYEFEYVVKAHCEDEEKHLFPELHNDFSSKDLKLMAYDMEKGRQHLFSTN